MEEIFKSIELMKKQIETSEAIENKEILKTYSDILSMLAEKVEEVIVKQEAIEENVGYMGEDLTDIQEELFEEVSLEDLMDIEDEYIEIYCKNCGKPLFVEKEALDNNNTIPCPFCNEKAK